MSTNKNKAQLYAMHYVAPIGGMVVAASAEGITGLWLDEQKYFGGTCEEDMADAVKVLVEDSSVRVDESAAHPLDFEEGKQALDHLSQAKNWLDRYFAGEAPTPDELTLAPRGTEFRMKVWRILCEIPYGKTTTYGDIAKQIAAEEGKKTMSSQAVGGAVGHNPISIIIPCHRVVGSTGSLTGYAGGIKRKMALLELEGADMDKFFVPKHSTAM